MRAPVLILLALLGLSSVLATPVAAAPGQGKGQGQGQGQGKGATTAGVPSGDRYAATAARLVRAKRYGEAITNYEKALAAGAGHFAVFELAQAHRLAGHVDEALVNYRLFLRLAPTSPLRFEVKGLVLKLRKVPRQAADRAAVGMVAPVERSHPTTTAEATPSTPMTAAPPTAASVEPAPPAPVSAPAVEPPTIGSPVEPAAPLPPPAPVAPSAAPVARDSAPLPLPSDPRHANEAHDAVASLGAPTRAAPTMSPPEKLPAAEPAAPPAVVARGPSWPPAVPASLAAEPLLRPVALDTGELTGATLVVGGGVSAAIAFALGLAAHQQAQAVNDAVRFDPSAEAAGQRYGAAAVALGVIGLAAFSVGGAIFAIHNERWEKATIPAHPARSTGTPATTTGTTSRALHRRVVVDAAAPSRSF